MKYLAIIIIIVLFISGCVSQSDNIIQKNNVQQNNIQENNSAFFQCENENSVKSRAYVLVRGFNDMGENTFDKELEMINKDSKTYGILDFSYDVRKNLSEISSDFVRRFNEFKTKNKAEEIVIIGYSAGGTIVSYSASRLDFNGTIEIHTIASPLKGYELRGPMESFAKDYTGYAKDLALGLDRFEKPRSNVKVYHHKNIKDDILEEYCGDFKFFCSSLKIQNNNIEGSKEFLYEGYTHETIMDYVEQIIIKCHN